MIGKIILATNNQHKLREIAYILGNEIELLTLKDILCDVDIPETGETLEANAIQKAEYVFRNYGLDAMADDSGLEVESLDNKPGVLSARYAGEDKDSEANIDKVLKKLQGIENRKAKFRTVIALILEGKTHLFEGAISGTIIHERKGNNGFGYDSIFMPDGYNQTFAEMDDAVKNRISHRALAIEELRKFLEERKEKQE